MKRLFTATVGIFARRHNLLKGMLTN